MEYNYNETFTLNTLYQTISGLLSDSDSNIPPDDGLYRATILRKQGLDIEQFTRSILSAKGNNHDLVVNTSKLARIIIRYFKPYKDDDNVLHIVLDGGKDLPDPDGTYLNKCIENYILDDQFRTTYAINEITNLIKKRTGKVSRVSANVELMPLSSFEKKQAEWLIQGYIPKNTITVIAGDGGVGKTFLWCNIAAAISTGNRCIFEEEVPFETEKRNAGLVIALSSEDSISYTLKQRIEDCGGDPDNIYSISLENDTFKDMKLNSPMFETMISKYKPTLVVLDPLQSFLPENTQMSSRNQMRALLNPLIGYGERYGCTFLIMMHANKLGGVWGRKRIADSSDMWDIARSVFLVGLTDEKGVHYISQEKNSYSFIHDSVLFSISGENPKATFVATSEKHDKDFILATSNSRQDKSSVDDVMQHIIGYLSDEENKTAPVKEVEESCHVCGYSDYAIRKAKENLIHSKRARVMRSGFGEGSVVSIKLLK